jgi:hypothetical protein
VGALAFSKRIRKQNANEAQDLPWFWWKVLFVEHWHHLRTQWICE